ncbi:Response regulator of zinc sigma-54-dependent two-component system [Minicystis rosea]|nr:Response regulator of zinc sigma-54-dependent two-component system [Minicystis rosea]
MLRLCEPSKALIDRFHAGDLDAHSIDEHPVLARWSRAAAAGLRADAAAFVEGTSDLDLATRRDRLEAVFREETPLLAPIAEELSASSLVALVVDPEGIILHARGGGAFVGDAARVRLVPGARWSEDARGTNAIGTAIVEQRPVAVVGRAHYEQRNHGLFCYAAPIRDAYGDMVAVLDVTGAVAYESAAVGLTVQAAGAALERALRLGEYAVATAGGFAVIERMLQRASSPALLVEATGAVVAMNGAARVVLGVDDHRTLTAERVFGASAGALRALALSPRAGGARFEIANKRYRLEFEPIDGSGGRHLALVVYLDPIHDSAAPARVATMGQQAARSTPARVSIHPAFDVVIGTDPDVVAAKELAARFAPTPLPILLFAETGTGKELFARAIHQAGPRASGAFVALNCGALAPSLLESELFGHGAGAFTGAHRSGADGKIAAADGGTLFLDEVAEMPEALQAALLRVLEDGIYYRVGEARPRKADFRLVCATCRDLPALLAAGRFRRDLFYRIHGACVTIPALRARGDRLFLARGLLARLAEASGVPCPELADDAAAWITAHSFPGNVRELKSALAHALVMAGDTGVITRACFPRVLLDDVRADTKRPRVAHDSGMARTRDAILRDAVAEALRETGGNLSEAARRLGVARSTLYRMMPPHPRRG